MSEPLEDGIKQWPTKRKSARVIEIIQGSCREPWPQSGRASPANTVAEASRLDDARKGMERAVSGYQWMRQWLEHHWRRSEGNGECSEVQSA